LYFVSYFTGITALIGVIIAHVQLAFADALLSTHYRFQIRTFWIGLLYLAIGIVLATAVVGIAVLFWWFIWSLVRNVKGARGLNETKPIASPSWWLFGCRRRARSPSRLALLPDRQWALRFSIARCSIDGRTRCRYRSPSWTSISPRNNVRSRRPPAPSPAGR